MMLQMKRIIFFVVVTLLCASTSSSRVIEPQTLLEVRMSGFFFKPWPVNFLFLRVTDDGQFEYEEQVVTDESDDFVLRKSRLSSSQLNDLAAFLNEPELRKAATEYEPDTSTIDHKIQLHIKIIRGSQSQTIELTNFSPSNKTKEKYPAKLVELVCKMRRLRENKRDNCREITAL